ncbi:MAG: ferrous iron transport protein A [Gemmatimonadetes bacterium]|nr:ferrous iron transport protein A [Gemmatimonadota bacterium]MCC6772491.1 ferrous iron transport protein A [Gemmatimonadaceae bacterium]
MRIILNKPIVANTRQLPAFAEADPSAGERPCALAQCLPGSRATVVDIACSADEGCRLRALGLYEGSRVCVIDSRHCMVLDVRGTRLALGQALTSGITVQPDRLRG